MCTNLCARFASWTPDTDVCIVLLAFVLIRETIDSFERNMNNSTQTEANIAFLEAKRAPY